MKIIRSAILVLSLFILMALLSACTPAPATEAPATEPAEMAPLRIALLPTTEVLPFFVAQAQGYFEDEGVEVEYVPVASAPDRDQLMQAGEIDGMLSELTSIISLTAKAF